MKIIGAQEVPCPVCHAQPGERCVYIFIRGGKRFKQFRFGAHSARVRDASHVTKVAQVLIES